MSLKECKHDAPDDACLSHASDSVVFCGTTSTTSAFFDGELRLIGASGAPVLRHEVGRLEMYLAHTQAWAPVCRKGFTSGSAAVACKTMGFGGSAGFSACSAGNVCGKVPPHVSALACAGSESSVTQCPMSAGDDVFCAPRRISGYVLHRGWRPRLASPCEHEACSISSRVAAAKSVNHFMKSCGLTLTYFCIVQIAAVMLVRAFEHKECTHVIACARRFKDFSDVFFSSSSA